MKLLAMLFALLIFATPAHAQCSVPGCDAATAVVADGRAKGAMILTAAAPPTITPQPPTSTPMPTQTPAPTNTPQPTATQTSAPTATPMPTMTTQPTVTATPAIVPASIVNQPSRIPGEAWCVLGIVLMCICIGALMRMASKWLKR